MCAACRQRGTLGVYANGTVYQPEFYLNASQPMEDGGCPCWIWCGWASTAGKRGLCGYTDGLAAFGKEEIEVLDTQAAPGDLHSFLLDLASYVLEEDVTFPTGRPSALPRGQYLPISRSAGVWHDGMTLKISYPEAVTAPPAYANAPAVKAAGAFVSNACAASAQAGIPPLKGLVDEDDVVSDPLDALPGDVELLPPAEQAEKAARAVDDDGYHLPLRHPHVQVRHVAQAAAVAER